MKLNFLFLFLFIANFCVAQNQLQLSAVHHAFGDTIEHCYYLHEQQEASVYFVNSKNKIIHKDGSVKEINDSFIIIKNDKIYYDSMVGILFNKSNLGKKFSRVGVLLALPEAILVGFTTLTIGLFLNEQNQNSKPSHTSGIQTNQYTGPLLIGSIGSTLYPMVVGVGIGITSFFNESYFYVSKKDAGSKKFCKMSVVHPSSK